MHGDEALQEGLRPTRCSASSGAARRCRNTGPAAAVGAEMPPDPAPPVQKYALLDACGGIHAALFAPRAPGMPHEARGADRANAQGTLLLGDLTRQGLSRDPQVWPRKLPLKCRLIALGNQDPPWPNRLGVERRTVVPAVRAEGLPPTPADRHGTH